VIRIESEEKLMKNAIAVLVALLVTVSGSAGGQGEQAKTEVRILNLKVEIADQFEKLKSEYEKVTPGTRVIPETVGGSADYFAALKVKLASGEPPDIFQNTGYSKLDLWVDQLEDLTDQPWVSELVEGVAKPITKNSRIYGQPEMLEGYYVIYNEDIFASAGIDEVPSTLKALEEVSQKLQAKGITAFSNAYQEFWILGFHIFNIGLAGQPDPDKFIEDAKAGTAQFAGSPAFADMLNYLDVTVRYGNKNPIATDYNTQVSDFAAGKAAMMQQGNWTQPFLDKISPDLNLGIFPMPVSNTPADRIYVATANNWVVYKQSKAKQEAKELLNWMVMSKEGQDIIVNNFRLIPPFKNFDYDPKVLGTLTVGMKEYLDKGKILGWYWEKCPEGTPQEVSNLLQAYIAGEKDRQQLLTGIRDAIVELSK
jgi:raffinose/stachyose/melibiose transport system substrate-binding protein